MRLIVAHNYYKQAGGEDEVFASEVAMLRARGHEVDTFVMRNDDIELMGKLAAFKATMWNGDSHARLQKLVREKRAQVVHFHNTFPLMSPAVYSAARDEGAAVVQTLHNFRFICPGATFYRDGAICEDCLGKVPWRAVKNACYRSRLTSAASVTMLTGHRLLGTYRNAIDAYIALSEFAKQKFIEGGLPSDKLYVKFNFVDPDPMPGPGTGGYALFVGRLTEEKGIRTMLEAWRTLNGAVPLKIAGDGPMRAQVEEAAKQIPGVQYLGRRPLPEIIDLLGNAAALVFPSVWYEGMPRVIVESMAKGTPIIASRLGTMAEMIEDGKTGWTFTAGSASELAATAQRALTSAVSLRTTTRQEFESNYTAAQNYDALMHIYKRAIERRAGQPVNPTEDCELADAHAPQ